MMRAVRPRLAPILLSAALIGCGTEKLTLAVPRESLVDAPVELRASGLEPGRTAAVEVAARDAQGTSWRLRRRMRADAEGRLRIGAGLLASLEPRDVYEGTYFRLAGAPVRFEVRVAAGDREIRRSVVRRPRAPDVRESAAGAGVSGTFVRPARPSGVPVILIGGSEGGASLGDVGGVLASHGHPALSLAYFGEAGLPRRLRRIPLERFARAARWVRRETGRVPALLGVSRGSEAALLTAAEFPDLVAGVVAYSPSAFANVALDGRTPSWTLRGRPVPTLPGEKFGRPAAAGAPGAIRVERIRGPIVTVSGGDDALWPSSHSAQLIERRGRDVLRLDHPEAGHGIGVILPFLPAQSEELGGTPAADAEARERTWPIVLEQLARLGSR